MNYIQQLNAFYDWTETNPLPASAINLWHALMQINNKCRWNDEFTAAISTLMAKTGCQRRSIFAARKMLADSGRLVWTTNGSQKAATYRLIPFATENEAPCIDQNKKGPAACTDPGTQAAPISKHKQKGKLNSIKEPEGSLSSIDDGPALIIEIFNDYNRICNKLPGARMLTKKRRETIGARLHEVGRETIVAMLEKASSSKFLAGDNDRGWVASFDWLFSPGNFAKVLEGNYANNRSAKANKPEFVGKPSPLELIEEAYNGIMNKQDEY